MLYDEFAKPENARALRESINSLFAKETAKVILATGHRAKGLEWPVVIHLDPWRVPSKYAKKAAQDGNRAQLQQELNLKYVIETRAKSILVEASLEDFS